MSLKTLLIGFIRYNKRWSCQALLFIAFITYLGISNLRYHLHNNTCLSYAIARTCGALLKWAFMPSIIPPISRVIFTEIRNSKIGRYVGLDRRIADHQLFALGATITALIHLIAHYFNNPASFQTRPGITGIIMLASLALPLFGVFLARRYLYAQSQALTHNGDQKYSYGAQVLRPHQVGATIFILAYACHTPDGRLIYFAVSMYGIYLLDRLIEYCKYNHTTKIRKAIKIPGTDYIMLTVDKPAKFGTCYPGQYALLSFPEIDAFLECLHPFTILKDDGTGITFLIRKAGPWTQRLSDLIDDVQTGYRLKIIIIGPFGSTLNSFNDHPSLTFIGTGIGVTPFLSYLNYMFGHNLQTPILDIHFTQRNVHDLIPCIMTLKNMNEINRRRINVHLYVTGNKSTYDDTRDLDLPDNVTLCFNPTKRISLRGSRWILYTERPNFDTIIQNANIVAVCGNPNVTKMVSSLTLKYNKRCLKETF